MWRAVREFAGYEVSDAGEVRRNGVPVPQHIGRAGYPHISVPGATRAVHRLVCEAFHGPSPERGGERIVVNHKNSVRTDNRAENLEWVTHRENLHHAMDTGAWNPRALAAKKLSYDIADLIFAERIAGIPIAVTAAGFDVCPSLVSSVWNGRRWGGAR